MLIVALEGPSFSGKTQLLSNLYASFGQLDLLAIACYVDEIIGEVPTACTRSTEEQLDAFQLFMTIEERRVQKLAKHKADLVILDRSVDTLLAHAYALDHLFGYEAYSQCRALLSRSSHFVPDLTFYLDASPATLQRRCKLLNQPFDSFLVDPLFISYFRSYFIPSDLAISRRIHIVNAEVSQLEVAENVTRVLSPSKESK